MSAEDAGAAVVVDGPGRSSQRSPSDVLRCVVAALLLVALLVVEAVFGGTLISFTRDLLSGLGAVPSWLVALVLSTTRTFGLVFLGGGLVITMVRGRWRFLATVAVAAAVAVVLCLALAPVDPTEGARVLVARGLGPSGFPTAPGLAAGAAIVTSAAPWLSRRWRRIAWAWVVALTASRFLASPIAFDSLRALVIGWFAGSGALVLLGGPSRRPSGAAIASGLEAAGVPLAELERASVDARGSTPYFARATDGGRLFVKALGADERSADLLFRLYRRIAPHDLGDERPFSSLRRTVEHEALLALYAHSVGIRTPRFVTLSRAEPNSFVLTYEALAGRALDEIDAADLTDELLRAVWTEVTDLHRAGIAHRDLRLANIFRADTGKIWLIDFGFSELAAGDLLIDTDCAELVASTATRVGPQRAVDAAVTVAGPRALTGALGRLRPWALSGATRTASKRDPTLLPTLRGELQRAIGDHQE